MLLFTLIREDNYQIKNIFAMSHVIKLMLFSSNHLKELPIAENCLIIKGKKNKIEDISLDLIQSLVTVSG